MIKHSSFESKLIRVLIQLDTLIGPTRRNTFTQRSKVGPSGERTEEGRVGLVLM